ncbi:NCS1 family nucleobase:cation symporter-1 [Cladophialophora psammophila CBS 110553]|uniref:NCS1 family nucleobase:cation symporter-1 n=1 Tax=Cladophialophora psammophila CBS 110553 TaxID=1182543 RepID=W9WH97_9EURO|nr:NCS1 family nucleobase:cation symporter-1 [Cladophialophora psammophila CBS 110553]EXJ57864.1 NCS1 family nucleobase:cation symporter-1 [Cladophialophora psammophila CBS 110553]
MLSPKSPAPQHAVIELDDFATSSSPSQRLSHWEAAEPLLSQSNSPAAGSLLKMRATMPRFPKSKATWLLSRLQTESEPGLTNAQLMLINHDLKPVEPQRRQWTAWSFIGMEFVAGIFCLRLAWWHALICILIGYSVSAMFVCSTGRIGAVYHISFPVVSRASFGIWGSLWPVFNRAAMACVWYGVQAWIGGQCITLMIRFISPSFYTLHNGIPNLGTNTRDFVGFFIFWVASLPAIWFPVHKIRYLFMVKSCFVPVAALTPFSWAIGRAHGIGPIVKEPATASGSLLAWGWMVGIMSPIANFATLIVNDPDFSRFARKPRDALWTQLFTIPIGFVVTSFVGIIVSSSSKVIYGTAIWNPLYLLSQFLLDDATRADRFGVFVIAAAFALAQLGTNIAANSVSAGTDMTALLPRYLNIRRGGYICAIIGLCMCPWNLLNTSNNFTTYLSAYSVFLSSIAGVIICDYYFVRKGYYSLKDLYSAREGSPYYYHFGVSWRAYTSYICGVLINVVGFASAVGAKVPIGANYIYRVNFFAGFVISSLVYYVLCWIKPVPATSSVWSEKGDEADGAFSVAGIPCDDALDEENSIEMASIAEDKRK